MSQIEAVNYTSCSKAPESERGNQDSAGTFTSMGQDAVDFVVQAQDREMRVPFANLELTKGVASAAHGSSAAGRGSSRLHRRRSIQH